MTPTRRPQPLRLIVALIAGFALIAAACGGGPDLPMTVDAAPAIQNRATAASLEVDGTNSDVQWAAEGTPTTVADSIASVELPDERSDDESGDVFLLYQSGTVWVTPSPSGGSAVLLYSDNDQAYSRHNGVLIRNSGWGTRVNNYRSSGSSNGFRGGGSSTGK